MSNYPMLLDRRVDVDSQRRVVEDGPRVWGPNVFKRRSAFRRTRVVNIGFYFKEAGQIQPTFRKKSGHFRFRVATFRRARFSEDSTSICTNFNGFRRLNLRIMYVQRVDLCSSSYQVILRLQRIRCYFRRTRYRINIFVFLRVRISRLKTFCSIFIHVEGVGNFLVGHKRS